MLCQYISPFHGSRMFCQYISPFQSSRMLCQYISPFQNCMELSSLISKGILISQPSQHAHQHAHQCACASQMCLSERKLIPTRHKAFYTSIFLTRFRNKQDENVTGISSSARVLRKRKNLVTIQFNLFNWLLETSSLILVVIEDNLFFGTLYLLVTSCGTPLVILFAPS